MVSSGAEALISNANKLGEYDFESEGLNKPIPADALKVVREVKVVVGEIWAIRSEKIIRREYL